MPTVSPMCLNSGTEPCKSNNSITDDNREDHNKTIKLRQGFLLALLSPHPGFGLLVLRGVKKLQNCQLLRSFATKSFQFSALGMSGVCCLAIFSLENDEAAPTWHLQLQTCVPCQHARKGSPFQPRSPGFRSVVIVEQACRYSLHSILALNFPQGLYPPL